MKKLSVSLLVVMLAMSFVACGDDDTDSSLVSGVDFTSYASSTLKVRNNSTSTDLVIFNGSLVKENIIGGVRGGAQAHGIKQPAMKQLYVINTVTLADYQKYINNLSACKITSSEMVYVDSDSITVDVYGDNSGNAQIYVNNTTKYHIEVRTGSFVGATLLVARPYENMTKYVVDGDYSLYPTVVVPIKNAEAVITGTRRMEDPAQIKLYGVYADQGTTTLTFTAAGITALKPSTAVIKVNNGLVGKGGCYLQRGTQQLKNTLGRGIINEGMTATYELKGDTGSDPKYSVVNNFGYNLLTGTTAITSPITQFTNGYEYLITIGNTSSTISVVGPLALE